MLENYDLSRIIEPLGRWFVENARALPWRQRLPGSVSEEGTDGANPYYVWLSEIMLQQTRVEAVKPYFLRFIRRIPDVAALAACPEEELLKLWEGLGYYNRARNLKAAAVQIMEDYGGRIPDDYEALLTLKGIGHYTAGAIASIAFDRPYPAVDGNVLRVISRVTADDSDIGKKSVQSRMEKYLGLLMQEYEKIVPPRIFNQALMELGAIVCLPNGEPKCGECPWESACLAKRDGKISELPVKTKPKKRRVEERTVLVIRAGGRVALHRRPDNGLLAGLYELPNQEGALVPETVLEELRAFAYEPLRIRTLPFAKHIFSHVEWRMRGYEIDVKTVGGQQGEVSDAQNRVKRQREETAGGRQEEPDEGGGLREERQGGRGGYGFLSELLFVEIAELKERYAVPAAFGAYMEVL